MSHVPPSNGPFDRTFEGSLPASQTILHVSTAARMSHLSVQLLDILCNIPVFTVTGRLYVSNTFAGTQNVISGSLPQHDSFFAVITLNKERVNRVEEN